MARTRRKADLPVKTCVVCSRPFAWRKKWARDWAAVKYCSQRCRDMGRPTADVSLSLGTSGNDGNADRDRR
jgi:hypothetical protein